MSGLTQVGHYQILNRIGAGGMGEVYLAHDCRLNRRVAIKMLPAELSRNENLRERLRREAMAAAALDHPFICKVFEIGDVDSELFIVMEYVDGETLHARMQREKLPSAESLRIVSQVSDAIELAHTRAFVHRDLKPANIMLTRQGYAKVMDFGLAKRVETVTLESNETAQFVGPQLTARGAIVGTPDYMSPEQVKGLPLDARSDLFSLGVILLEMLCGRHPFRRQSIVETMAAILHEQPDFSGDIPQGLMVLLRRLLSKEPDDRCPSITDFQADLKGLSTALDSVDRPRTEPDRIPLIGRDVERNALFAHLDGAMAGRGSLVMIGGEPGIGKTHLITALLDEVRRRGAFANIGHCYEMEGSPPYIPFIEMLEYSIRTVPREAFRHALGDAAPEVAKLAPELRRIFPDIAPALELPPEQQRRFLFNAYREFVERAARVTPIVAVFEDLHWADESTLLLLQHLALSASTIPLLIIGTYRDVELDVTRPFAKTLETLLRQKQAIRMPLRRLPVAGVEQMLAVLSGQVPPPSLARVVFEETEGNPFFVEEVFRHLAEEGKLFDESGIFRSGLRVDQLQVPEGVRLVLGRRLERLGEEARRILTTAAVIGRVFSLQLLEALETTHADAVLDAMEEAEKSHIVVVEAGGRETRYKFVHELVRQTLAERLSLPRRQRLHVRVADAMEKHYASSLESHVPALAHHLFQAGAAADLERTVHFLSEAARLASTAVAHEEALAHLDNALALLEGERTIQLGDLHVRRAEALRSLRREKDAVEAYVHALELFELLGDDMRFIQAGVPLSFIHVWSLRFEEAFSIIDRMKTRMDSATADTLCMVFAVNAMTFSSSGDVERAIELHKHWERIPEEQLSAKVLGLALQCRAHSHNHAMQWYLSEQSAQRAQSILRQIGDVWSVADVDYVICAAHIFQCRFEDGVRSAQEAIQRAMRIGHQGSQWATQALLGYSHFFQGNLELGEQHLKEASDFAESVNLQWGDGGAAFIANFIVLCDRVEEATILLKRAVVMPKTHWTGAAEALMAMGLAIRKEGGVLAALRSSEQILLSHGEALGTFGEICGLCYLLQGYCLLGRRSDAARWREAAELIASINVELLPAFFPTRTMAGIAAACALDWERAEYWHRESLQQVDATSAVTLQLIVRYWYADMLLERRQGDDLQQARDLLHIVKTRSEEIGLALYARLAREKLSTGVQTLTASEAEKNSHSEAPNGDTE